MSTKQIKKVVISIDLRFLLLTYYVLLIVTNAKEHNNIDMDEELKQYAEPTAEGPMSDGVKPVAGAVTEPVEPQADNNVQSQIDAIVSKFVPAEGDKQAALLKTLQMLDNLHEKFLVAVEIDPDFGEALSYILGGESARVALARAYGPDAFEAVEGDPDYDKMSEAFNAGREKVTKKRKLADDLKKNQEMSIQEITSYMKEKGYAEEEITARLQKMEEIRQDFLNDKIMKKHLEIIDKALDFDTAVAQAEEAGKVTGRNEKIVNTRESAKTMGDNLPSLTARNPKKQPPQTFGEKFLNGVI